jgi:hypothetical protein
VAPLGDTRLAVGLQGGTAAGQGTGPTNNILNRHGVYSSQVLRYFSGGALPILHEIQAFGPQYNVVIVTQGDAQP